MELKFCNFEKNESSIKLSEFVNQSLEAEQLCLADLIALEIVSLPITEEGPFLPLLLLPI